MGREFIDTPAVRAQTPLLLGIVGPSSSGKTFSALRLATGMQRVIGGDIFYVDTEARRALHYADRFKFRHVPFDPPLGPLDYLAAIEHCIKKGARILVIDSMTHEHSGPGGVMDQSEAFLQKKCGDDPDKREKWFWSSLAKPKAQRKQLNAAIVRLGINAIFCYRADEKIKPITGGAPIKLGWQPETTSKLHYDMTQRFLLTPGCDGVPSLMPETDLERRMVKTPEQFRNLFKSGVPLSEEIGQMLAEWAAGGDIPAAGAKPSDKPVPQSALDNLEERYRLCSDAAALKFLEEERAGIWSTLSRPDQKRIKAAADAARDNVAKIEDMKAAG